MKQQQNRLPGVVPPACRAIRGDMVIWPADGPPDIFFIVIYLASDSDQRLPPTRKAVQILHCRQIVR
jgi:hypothetical protein